ncbi:MAG: hypothetical protein HQL80_06540 [Magnetococcales bacterium]|nr:hypothetical protein [Magnetococcales bacterium]
MTLLLILGETQYLPLLPLMILAQRFPAQRLWIAGLGGGGLFLYRKLLELEVTHLLWFVMDAGFIVGLLYLFFRVARSFTDLPPTVRKNPQIFLHVLLWGCILSLFMLPANFRDDPAWFIASRLTECLAFFAFLIWRIGLMLYAGKRGSIKKHGFVDHFIYVLPYLGSTQVPYGKGLDYLTQKQANSRLDLAKSQLAGLKLLILSYLWQWLLDGLGVLFFDHSDSPDLLFPIPLTLYHMDTLIALSGHQTPSPAIVWASLIMDMVYETIQLAIIGHLIVGCLRLLGFNVFRNTYKPLLSVSLVEFWNRYYYYFKELLVDFFFFPTYLKFFKNHPKLRVFTATMASAFVGNFYYHFLQHFDEFIVNGNLLPFVKFNSYLFYSFMLGIGIFISMIREQNRRGQPVVQYAPRLQSLITLRKIAGVWLFFSILRIWDHANSAFMQDTAFFFALFGIHF